MAPFIKREKSLLETYRKKGTDKKIIFNTWNLVWNLVPEVSKLYRDQGSHTQNLPPFYKFPRIPVPSSTHLLEFSWYLVPSGNKVRKLARYPVPSGTQLLKFLRYLVPKILKFWWVPLIPTPDRDSQIIIKATV